MAEPVDNTKELPGALDAFETLQPGEPHFTLQGGDPMSPALVLTWAMLARYRAGYTKPESLFEAVAEQLRGIASQGMAEDEAERQELLLRAGSAEEVAWAMQAFQKQQPLNSDDAADARQGFERPTMSGAGNDDALNKLLDHRQRLANSRAVDDMVARLGDMNALPSLLDQLREFSSSLLPKRKSAADAPAV